MKQPDRFDEVIESLRRVPPPDDIQRARAKRDFLQQAARYREEPRVPSRPAGRRVLRMVAVVVAVLAAFVLMGAGVARASDAAAPGDALYGVDLAVEKLQLKLTRDPAQAVSLRLSHAAERLAEAEQLTDSGQSQEADAALAAYGDTVSHLSESVDEAAEPEQAALAEQVDQALAVHQSQLLSLLETAPAPAIDGLQRAIEATEHGRDNAGRGATPPGRQDELEPADSAPGNSAHDEDSPAAPGSNGQQGPPDHTPGETHGNSDNKGGGPPEGNQPTPAPPAENPGQGQGRPDDPGNSSHDGENPGDEHRPDHANPAKP